MTAVCGETLTREHGWFGSADAQGHTVLMSNAERSHPAIVVLRTAVGKHARYNNRFLPSRSLARRSKDEDMMIFMKRHEFIFPTISTLQSVLYHALFTDLSYT
jgi:hypothetical protein